ncbi:CRISPR-associated endonuclease Csn1 [Kandleria vitulina]|uniref:type II CRISPR RNA-guided endonuclease Cas9 n=1 Tax=Kandleria vitulina TaxID=1630 RepID=UPI00087E08ED|nr:type II CRISPR RNA-guided endonuclease Cas9 [Kandleria vitulina]SDM20938.1 CRISPR-associated endonuclease Csn1 [Kandleria vitulina]
MSQNNNKIYNIGLDIGDASVGWAVVDEHYNLLKRHGKHMWGSRLFTQANTAVERRSSRSIRRRYNKRRERIRLLRGIMEEMVLEKDPTFFIRLANVSFLDHEDKKDFLGNKFKSNYNLFIDEEFNDKTYYEKYPTIYHLRKHLCESKEKEDPRLIYLALHHIVKYRGNFLYEGQKFTMDVSNIEEKMINVLSQFNEINLFDYEEDTHKIDEVLNVLKEPLTKKHKSDKVLALFETTKETKSAYKELCNALVGNKFNVTKMLKEADLHDEDEKEISFKFSDATFDDAFVEKQPLLGDCVEFIDLLHDIYSWVELQNILGSAHTSEPSISAAMIQRYEDHKNDLKLLKDVIRKYLPKKYFEVFRDEKSKKNNYCNYINHPSKTPVDEFYKYIKKLIENIDDPDVNTILDKMELETFMLKQNSRTNGAIPYQMQLDELNKILENQAPYYPSLKENEDKIRSILTFRIPYYFGPLNPTKDHEFDWIKKLEGKENERILPWNVNEIVDVDKTADEFIKRMRNFCTYFPNEPVMAKNSLTVSKYEVLNEINKLRINDHLIKRDMKDKMLHTLFMDHKSISANAMKKWLVKNQYFSNTDDIKIEGFQKENACSTSLTPWIDFTKIFGEINNSNYELIEKIIYDITVFEDEKILKRRLRKVYELDDDKIKKILKLRYSGWSRLSKKLLNGIKSNVIGREPETIIQVMERTNMNLMQVINDDKLGFKKTIEEANSKEITGKFKYDEVRDLAGSPAIKRGIWQALLIVDEIKKIMGHEPAHVYIEFARNEDEKERTDSFIKKTQALYKDYDFEDEAEKSALNDLKKEDNKSKIRSERLKLYYTQMGKCMYTGKALDIDKLETYQVDHIVPQSLLKDDSIDNKVLVLSSENQRKLDDLVIPSSIRNKMYGFWEKLFNNKIISPKKFYSLIKTEFNEKDQERFINRQIVETRQITKHVAQIIDNHYENTKVVTVRADLSHQFRERYHIYKNRDINDFHHAHDAYIATILGTYIGHRFESLDAKYIYGEYQKIFRNNKNRDKEFNKNKDGFILNSMRNLYADKDTGEVVWDPEWISRIKKCFYYNDCFVTKKLEENNGSFFNLTVRPNDEHSEKGTTIAKVPVNKLRSNVHKYGGFEGLQYGIVAIKGKKKKGKKIVDVNKLVGIPLMYKNVDDETKINYIKESEGLEEVKIVKEIFKNQLIEINGGLFYVTSPTEIVNARQLILDVNSTRIIDGIYKAMKYKNYSGLSQEEIMNVYDIFVEKLKLYYPTYKNIATNFENMREQFENISDEEKCEVIRQMLVIMHAGPQNGNITFDDFKMSGRMGRMSKKTISLDNTDFIADSPTGMYSKKYKL